MAVEKTPVRKQALGKGFNSLLGLGDDDTEAKDLKERTSLNSVLQLSVNEIDPNPHQPRKIFTDEALNSLSQSIKVDGVIQPIIVSRPENSDRYILIAGERRWRASKMAGLTTIPAILKEASPDTQLRVALIENIQRADLNIIEEAEAYQSLIKDFGLTQDQCAQKVGKDRTSVTNALRLLALPREIQDDLMSGKISMGHGRSLLSLEEKKLMLRAKDIILKKQLSVRQTEQLCKRFKSTGDLKGGTSDTQVETNADLEYLADSIRSLLRTKVRIIGNSSRGKLEISYFSAAELERIIGTMGVEVE